MQEPESVTIGVIVGATVTKLLSYLIRRNFNEGASIRKELREEINHLREEIKELHNELDEWKERFFKLHLENTKLHGELMILKNRVNKIKEKEEKDS